MSISGLGSVTGVSGTQYDFTNMTNAQAYSAANQLGNAGKITVGEQAMLMQMAQDGGSLTACPPGPKAATYIADNMSSTTPQNYLTDVANKLAADIRSPDPSGINVKEIATDNALLTALTAYQGTAESASGTSISAGGIISTTA
jgi:hypothetical protein